jgi:hypothetical protein
MMIEFLIGSKRLFCDEYNSIDDPEKPCEAPNPKQAIIVLTLGENKIKLTKFPYIIYKTIMAPLLLIPRLFMNGIEFTSTNNKNK